MTEPVTLQVQPTPNINALKFLTNRRLTEGRSRTFRSAEEASGHPLAARLFGVPGVVQVFLLNDFVTVTRDPGAAWDEIAQAAGSVIREYLEGG